MIRKSITIRYKDLTEEERKEFTDRFYRCWNKVFGFDDNPNYWWDDMQHGFGYPWEYIPDDEVVDPEAFLRRNWMDFVVDHISALCNELSEEAERNEKNKNGIAKR